MNFSAWFKSKTSDKVLSPVRDQVIDFIDEGSRVLEIGCGTGDLLLRASGKVKLGLGIDIDPGMIEFAKKRFQEEGINNLEFISNDLKLLSNSALSQFNISTSTLCLHEMKQEDAISTLSLLGEHSTKIIIADYATPSTVWGKVSIELDELISGHYLRFRSYRKRGGFPYLAKMAGLGVFTEIPTSIDGIIIWVLDGRHSHNNGS